MRVTADTNVLLRVTLRDDPLQARAAQEALREATLIAVTLPTLCEFAWVLSRSYRQTPDQVALAIRTILSIDKVRVDKAATEAGLAMMASGGDFADGVILFEGRRLGGETYLTFDKQAHGLTTAAGGKSLLLAGTPPA